MEGSWTTLEPSWNWVCTFVKSSYERSNIDPTMSKTPLKSPMSRIFLKCFWKTLLFSSCHLWGTKHDGSMCSSFGINQIGACSWPSDWVMGRNGICGEQRTFWRYNDQCTPKHLSSWHEVELCGHLLLLIWKQRSREVTIRLWRKKVLLMAHKICSWASLFMVIHLSWSSHIHFFDVFGLQIHVHVAWNLTYFALWMLSSASIRFLWN